MFTYLSGLTKKTLTSIAGVTVLILTVIAGYFKIKRDGKKEGIAEVEDKLAKEEAKVTEKVGKDEKILNDYVNKTSKDERESKYRNKFSRKDE